MTKPFSYGIRTSGNRQEKMFLEARKQMENLRMDEDEIEMTKMIFTESVKRKTKKRVRK